MEFDRANSFRFWEKSRILFSVVLVINFAVITRSETIATTQQGWSILDVLVCQYLYMSYVTVPNILYCAAYPVDIWIQHAFPKRVWLFCRFGVFMVGLFLAFQLVAYFNGRGILTD